MKFKSTSLKFYYIFLDVIKIAVIYYNRVLMKFVKPPLIKSMDETLEVIVNEGFGVSRYGDGEFSLMSGEDLLFQPYNKELSIRLKEIIKVNQNNHIVCVPYALKDYDWCTDKSRNYWRKYFDLNYSKINKLIDRTRVYHDSQVTRLYIDHQDKSKAKERFSKFKILWDNRQVLIVEGEHSRLGISNNLFDNVRSVRRIICPVIDAFAKYNEILEEVQKNEKSKLILIALGPTATVLAYDLSKLGYQAIDIGHIDIEYEWFLQGAEEKCPIKDKYIGEVPNGTEVGEIDDSVYTKEIIARVI